MDMHLMIHVKDRLPRRGVNNGSCIVSPSALAGHAVMQVRRCVNPADHVRQPRTPHLKIVW